MPWPEPDGSVRVRSFVPSGFEAYVRIDHPEVEGEMPREVEWGLKEYLPSYTRTPDRVFYAAWDGRDLARDLAVSMPRLHAPKRTYVVFLGDSGGPYVDLPDDAPEWVAASPLIVNVWWPEDRAWCVVTEIDSRETFVGCSSACARALLDDELLEAVPASLLDRLDDAGRNAGA